MPLAHDLRPKTLNEFIGQEKLVGENGPIKKFIETKQIPSMMFWGPPGSGKTTLAEIIANSTDADFLRISAVVDGKDALKKVIDRAKQNRDHNKETILFIDEIHRWNKAQQDALLPYVENGTLILIGATTENPSFSIISPLLSRSRVFVFTNHSVDEIVEMLKRGAEHLKVKYDTDILMKIAQNADGDIRYAITTLEIAAKLAGKKKLTDDHVTNAMQRALLYDKHGEEHYNLISAVHKSLRSSNPTAGVYWVMRMLEAGEDPLYIARRLIRFASEDIGNANPNALLLANQVYETCKNIGMPECDVALAQLAEYLAKSPKNNASYVAANLAKEDIRKYGTLPVPLHFRNAPTKLMKELDYGKDYIYDHDVKDKKSGQQAMPDKLKDRNYFRETEK